MKRILIPAVLAAVLLTGCGDKAFEQFKDAHVNGRNSGPAEVINMPDGFNNAADKCDHGNRVYTLFHGDSKYGGIAVVPHDPTCK